MTMFAKGEKNRHKENADVVKRPALGGKIGCCFPKQGLRKFSHQKFAHTIGEDSFIDRIFLK